MKPWQLDRRVDGLSERLKDLPSECVRIDFDSFPEPEKLLLKKVWALHDKYAPGEPPEQVIKENAELVFKACEVIVRRVVDLFVEVMPMALVCDDVEEWYFKLHFLNFLADWGECFQRVRKWSKKDREEFLTDMKESGMLDKVFRIPRGFNDHNAAPVEGDKKGEVPK